MDDSAGVHVGETPHTSINSSGRNCHDSVDSGYLSTPRFGYTPIVSTGYRNKLSGVSAKRQRNRPDPWQNEKPQRHRSKLCQLLSVSEPNYSVSDCIEHDSILESSCTNKSVSFVAHSTPSCTNNEFTEAPAVSKNKRNWKTMVPFTPVFKDLQLLSPPPSPAVYITPYVASETIEEDVEMKLTVAEEDTRQITTLPQHEVSVPRIIISPVRRNRNSIVTSAENHQLSKLSITDLIVIPEIKPKRLDFSHRGLSELWSTDTCSDYSRKEKVDFLSLLGEEINLSHLVSRILRYLEPQDLCSVSMVSTTWKRICSNDPCANKRRISHILCKQNFKENIKMVKKIVKHEEDTQTSSKSRYYARKGCLQNVQNLLHVPLQPRPPNSPPVSPSKVKFHSFVKASRTLAHGEYLLPCPRCTFPSHVDSEKNVGTCTRQGCSIEFCSSCSSKPHTGPCKTPLLATPTKRNKRLIVGSRQSKRNLRRL